MFTEKFDSYVCFGDSITTTVDGFDITATIDYDMDAHIDDDDCHNTDQGVTGCNDKQQEDLVEARKAWFNDEWCYVGVVLSVQKNGVTLEHCAASLWGIEANYPNSTNDYLTDVANELLPEAIEQAKHTLQKLIG